MIERWLDPARGGGDAQGLLALLRALVREGGPDGAQPGAQPGAREVGHGETSTLPGLPSDLVLEPRSIDGLARTLARYGAAQVSRFSARRWMEEAHLSASEAERVRLAFEVGRQVERAQPAPRTRLTRASEVARLMQPEVRGRMRESFYSLVLDASQRLVLIDRVSEGTLSTAPVHPREVFRSAIRAAGASLIVVHNHPSGDPEPSQEDIAVTRRLIRAGELLGVPLVDHVVLGDGSWVSLRKRIPFEATE